MTQFFKLTVVIFLLTPLTAQGSNETSFSAEELQQLSPFDPSVQEKVLSDVIRLMDHQKDNEKEIPPVRVSESVSEEETEVIAACEHQGMPGWALAKGINIYLFKLNMILLGSEMKLHNLAHEYAHYVQLKYDQMDEREFSLDYPEQEAVYIQNYFREPFN